MQTKQNPIKLEPGLGAQFTSCCQEIDWSYCTTLRSHTGLVSMDINLMTLNFDL